MKKIKVFIPVDKFQQKIEILVKNAHQKLSDSKSLYAQAENLILKELELEKFNPSNEKISINH